MDEDKAPDECKVWSAVEWKIDALFPLWDCQKFSEAPPLAKWNVGNSIAGFSVGLWRAEKPFRGEIETAVRARCSGQEIAVSPEVRYFLNVRAAVICWLVRKLEITGVRDACDLSQTIIPFPETLSPSEIVRWLMIDWWNGNGPEIAAMLRLFNIQTGAESATA